MAGSAAAFSRLDALGTMALMVAAALAVSVVPSTRAADDGDLIKLLGQRRCTGCRLQDADLVHADLRDADLSGARLQRANLGQARLDGANLSGADLSFTSLQGASLRGADLRGARLEGTDLRRSDLSGAQLDPGGLSRSHWEQARGVDPNQLSYPELHNAGVEASVAGRQPEAERLFGEAIRQQPDAPVSWVARGIARSEQGKIELAVADLDYAASLYEQGGDVSTAQELRQVSAQLQKAPDKNRGGNGMGGQLLNGAMGLATTLAPLAVKFLVPMAL
ncbi:pentapeptide repeat-containing protein [Cyanobium sp. FGCU-6]|nr:pentapeptide repeat-containing protein [Cyanobium sp. FGCU6]